MFEAMKQLSLSTKCQRRLLRDLPAARSVDEVEALLPWNLRLPDFPLKTTP